LSRDKGGRSDVTGEQTGEQTERKSGSSTDTVRVVIISILVALGVRTFVVEPFKIPSGSMIPTLLVGDYILVNKFAYGLRMPFTGKEIVPVGHPERGDVVVFRYPDGPNVDYIKRVIGLPGDTVEIKSGRVWVNGQIVDRLPEDNFSYRDYADSQRRVTVLRFREINPEGREYTILQQALNPRLATERRWEVPEDSYFMLGDNRDSSRDSRFWDNPFVADELLRGKAFIVHWSWVIASGGQPDRGFLADFLHTLGRVITFQVERVRWDRIGRRVDGVAEPGDADLDDPA
jgi:signal peptidase I